MTNTFSPLCDEVVTIYKEACRLRKRIGQLVNNAAMRTTVDAETTAVELVATLESLLGECIQADMEQEKQRM